MAKLFLVSGCVLALIVATGFSLLGTETPMPLLSDTNQVLERTCFQTAKPWSPRSIM
jgi:hypothetical protein